MHGSANATSTADNAASASGTWRRHLRDQRRHWRRQFRSRGWDQAIWGYGAPLSMAGAARRADGLVSLVVDRALAHLDSLRMDR